MVFPFGSFMISWPASVVGLSPATLQPESVSTPGSNHLTDGYMASGVIYVDERRGSEGYIEQAGTPSQ